VNGEKKALLYDSPFTKQQKSLPSPSLRRRGRIYDKARVMRYDAPVGGERK
jgi:hypothetical protein